MPHLDKFPALDEVQVTPLEMQRRMTSLGTYATHEDIGSYSGETTPSIILAWAQFANTVIAECEDDVITCAKGTLKLLRSKDVSELHEQALSEVRSDRYYHPEKYPEDYRPTMSDPEIWETIPESEKRDTLSDTLNEGEAGVWSVP
jgi:hypothetical protein